MYSVMIVDDYEVFRKAIVSMPVWGEKTGFQIAGEAANGREAYQKLRQDPVDLLITDIRMPLINGLELLKKVTEEKLCSCVILMSQFSDFEYARQGLSNGAFEYLLKPVGQEELSSALQRAAALLDERRQEKSKINYLENILSKSADEYFPDTELDTLVNLLNEGSPGAADAASYLVDVTYAELRFDIVKTAHVLGGVLKQLIDGVQAEYGWLGSFISLQDLKMIDFSRFADIVLLKAAFLERINRLLSTIRTFELGIDNSSMVRMVCKAVLEGVDTDLSVSELADRLFITRTYLSQVFKEKTGTTLVKYITDVKMERAKVLVAAGIKNHEISEKLGYKDDEYFKKLFKKATGMTINEYKSQLA